ncbi:MAG: metalloregulator ArsR/SmtB family transcription factor [Terrisporobacter sp.]|uniref:ArsR/SmtB family transcription factor n=1 Tax=Terrisporobacter sp. TaxID=1965305 RepID=UPI002FC9CE00
MEEKSKKLARVLKVLANENRLLILYYLLEKPMTVGELNKKIKNITQSGLSQHLSMLKAHDLLDSNKEGLNITYFVKDKKIQKILQVLRENYSKED